MINVRNLERKIEKGLVEGKALQRAEETLQKIERRDYKVDAFDVINNEGTYGTEVVVTKEGHIDLYLCIMKRWSSHITYVRVGNFQPEFNIGDVYLMNGQEKEYKKLGNIINAVNKEYEKYGFYFNANTNNNRKILADARQAYIAEQDEIRAKEKEQQEVERLQNALIEKREELLEKELTFSIDGEGTVEEVVNVSYEDANKNFKRRLHLAPNPEDGYNKTHIRIMIDGKLFHKLQIGLKSD